MQVGGFNLEARALRGRHGAGARQRLAEQSVSGGAILLLGLQLRQQAVRRSEIGVGGDSLIEVLRGGGGGGRFLGRHVRLQSGQAVCAVRRHAGGDLARQLRSHGEHVACGGGGNQPSHLPRARIFDGEPRREPASADGVLPVSQAGSAGSECQTSLGGDAGHGDRARSEHQIQTVQPAGGDGVDARRAGQFGGDDIGKGAAHPVVGNGAEVLEAQNGDALDAGCGWLVSAGGEEEEKQEARQGAGRGPGGPPHNRWGYRGPTVHAAPGPAVP
jgi:hypothetical protein